MPTFSTVLSVVLSVAGLTQPTQAFRIRTKRRGDSSAGRGQQNATLDGNVDALYTWGAPMVVQRVQSNPRSGNGCWPGLRMYNVNVKGGIGIHRVDPVPPLLRASAWSGHPQMAVAKMSEDGKIDMKPCGWRGFSVESPKIELHMPRVYIERWGVTGNTEDEWLSTLSNIALRPSYLHGADEVAAYIRPYGWKIVGSAHKNEKVSHLLQDPTSLECVITFQGTDRPMDWWDNLQFGTAPFCGLPVKVHQGFRSQTRWMTQDPQWQSNIRSKLGKCKRVFATGHSLGGAMATLFTMCVAQAPPPSSPGYVDFQSLGWQQETPEVLTPTAQ